MNFLKTLRNNWKKSTLAFVAITYGVRYVDTEITNNSVLRSFCEEAVKFGDQPLSVTNSPRKIVVILNPAANKRKAKAEFEKYCAPILHLSGAAINVITTEEENGARNIMEKLSEKFDAIVVAGGDGTLSEVITGLLRRFDGNGSKSRSIPIGILPLGRTNTIANKLYCYNNDNTKSDKTKHVRSLANASFAIVNEDTEKLNILRIENLESENNSRPIYAVGGLQWGAFRNAHNARDNFWYFGKFRSYATYVLGYQNRNKKIDTILEYSAPCTGCKNCYQTRDELKLVTDSQSSRWWNVFLPIKKHKETSVDYKLIENDNCGVMMDRHVKSVELNAEPSFIGEIPKINISIGPEQIGYFNFIKEGWNRERNMEPSDQEVIEAQQLKITPMKTDVEEMLSIDNEEYEVKKMCITLLQHSLTTFKMCQLNI